ncbi:hypothetical protein AB0F81_06700 [Actinoplanes sp. NPDC024001]|uniref:hypothetical protein n=1 Tax=Actinoplanes sp. NPDC024001 TaxID=3154598 RepID=UPI0033EED0C8
MFYANSPGRVARAILAPVLFVGALGWAGASPATAAPTVRGHLLPVPAAGAHRQISVWAVDVSPLGVVAGNVEQTTTAPDGSASYLELPQRWAEVPGVGWLRQQLALPAGATSGRVNGLTDPGEAAGSVTLSDGRAARWSIDGRYTTLIGGASTSVTAVGPHGPWAVLTYDDDIPVIGESELVTRDNVRTPLSGTPDLDTGSRRSVSSVGGPDTAIVWVGEGLGQGRTSRPVLWKAGATLRFPVISSYFLGPACTSEVQADGSTVYSGYLRDDGEIAFALVRHVGGVPGADITLSRATGAGQPTGGLDCTPASSADTLASDGGVAGYLTDTNGRQAAYWDAANTLTVVAREAGEQSASGVAVADGGRMVILAQHDDGTSRVSLWDNGMRTRLTTPAGWTVTSVVELTDAGLLVANARNAAGVARPIAWNLTGRVAPRGRSGV